MFDHWRIRQARQDARLTQAELARRLGKKSADSVRKYERGLVEPPGHVVAQIAKITGKPRRWFVEEDPSHTAPLPDREPDAPMVPLGLQRLADMGVPLRSDELEDLIAYADPRNPARMTPGAQSWTPGQGLDALLQERRRGWK
jgi:transcriptional regulator with XRE-family HTH domain